MADQYREGERIEFDKESEQSDAGSDHCKCESEESDEEDRGSDNQISEDDDPQFYIEKESLRRRVLRNVKPEYRSSIKQLLGKRAAPQPGSGNDPQPLPVGEQADPGDHNPVAVGPAIQGVEPYFSAPGRSTDPTFVPDANQFEDAEVNSQRPVSFRNLPARGMSLRNLPHMSYIEETDEIAASSSTDARGPGVPLQSWVQRDPDSDASDENTRT